MKTAISIADGVFARFERIAARHGMNRSEFYWFAGQRLADDLEGEAELTAIAVLARIGEPPTGDRFVRESQPVCAS